MPKFYKVDDINRIDLNALVSLLPGAPMWNPFSTQGRYITAILRSWKTLERYEINTPRRIAHFLGQGLIETGFLRFAAENLNYSADRLRVIFPNHVQTEEQARALHRDPEAIANVVYGGRLGNDEPGDGWKYRGRGFFQLTGKDNYRRFGEIAGIDLVNNPEIIENDLKTSVEVAAAYFDHVNLGRYADENDARAVSRGVNRGNPESPYKAHSEDDRVLWTARVLDLFENPDMVIEGGAGGAPSPTVSDLRSGATGPAVEDLQRKLLQLGYPVGAADGIFGRKTTQAVILFQNDSSLTPTGVADEETLAALDQAVEEDTKGNVDIYREARSDRSIKREVGATDGTGAGGAVAGAAGAGGVAYETGTLDGVVEAGREILQDGVGPDGETPPTDEPPAEDDPATEDADGAEQPAADEDAPEDAPVDDAVPDEAADDTADEPTDEPADEPADEQPVDEEPTAEEPTEEPPADEQPADDDRAEDVPAEEPVDEPVTDDTTTEAAPEEGAPPVEEPAAAEPPAEEPVEEAPATEDTPADEPAEDEAEAPADTEDAPVEEPVTPEDQPDPESAPADEPATADEPIMEPPVEEPPTESPAATDDGAAAEPTADDAAAATEATAATDDAPVPADPPSRPDTGTGTEISQPPPSMRSDGEIDWMIVLILALVVLFGMYVFLRARRKGRKIVDAYRDRRI